MKRSKTLSLFVLGVFLSVQPAFALPQGAQVVSGEASFFQPSSDQLNVTTSDKVIINYDQFNIGSGERVQFIQPSASSLALNRVVGSEPSFILGSLSANGRVFLINPNGMIFGHQARIDTAAFVASTLNMTDQDFLNGHYVFDSIGAAGDILNQGVITASQAVALLGHDVKNEGVILVKTGTVALATGNKITLDLTDDGLLSVALNGNASSGSVSNQGMIKAQDGTVLLTARIMNDAVVNAINNEGVIEATSLVNDGGVVRLVSEGDGVISHSGSIDASGAKDGGQVEIVGQKVGLFGSASIKADGETGGGQVLIGGDFQGKNAEVPNAQATFMNEGASISANALKSGNGGKVILWSDGVTNASGSIAARGVDHGGIIETSGHMLNTGGIRIDAGQGGLWLLDPYDVTITTGATSNGSFDSGTPNVFTASGNSANVDRATIEASLDAGTSVTISTAGGGAENGDINVNATITKSAGTDAVLTMTANRDINVNSAISNTTDNGSLYVTLTANRNIDLAADITTKGGDILATATTGKIDSSLAGITLNSSARDTGVAGGGDAGVIDLIAGTSIGVTNTVDIIANGDDSQGINAANWGGMGGILDFEAGTTYHVGSIIAYGGAANSAIGAGVGIGGDGGYVYAEGTGSSQLGNIDLHAGNGNSTDGGAGGWGGFLTIVGHGAGTIDLNQIDLRGGTGYGASAGGYGGDLFVAGYSQDVRLNDVVNTSGGSGPINGRGGNIDLNSDSDIILNGASADIATNGLVSIFAGGTYSQNNAGSSVTSGDGMQIFANDIDLTGTINTGSSSIDIYPYYTGGTIGLGNTAATMTISGSELQRMTATDLNIGDNSTGNITVDGITAVNSANISGTTYLTALRDNSRILFVNNSSSFGTLAMGADDGISVGADVTTTVGDLAMNGDYAGNVDTYDNIDIAGGVTLTSAGGLTLNATTGGILLSGANGSTVTLSTGNDGLLYAGAPITDTNNVNLNATSQGGIMLYGATSLGTGTYAFSADSDNDSTAQVTLNGALTGNAELTFSGGGTGTNDTLDLNADMTGSSITIQNFSVADLASGVDLVANSGAVTANSNVTVLNLSGANGTANAIDAGSNVSLATLTDTNNPNLTVTSDGDTTLAGASGLGSGNYSFAVDVDDNSTSTLALNGAVTGGAALTFSGGGTGTNDTFDDNADLSGSSLTIQNFSNVDLAAAVDWTVSGAISASTNVGSINLSGIDATTNIITSTGDAAVTLASLTDTNNPDLLVYSDGDLALNGAANLGTGFMSFQADTDDDSVSTLAINGAITGQALMVFTGGGAVGFNVTDTLDINADITAEDMTMQVFSVADLAGSVDLTANNGIIELGTVGSVNLSGANATTNVLTALGGSSYVELANVTDTNNPNLTVSSEGDIMLAGLTSLGAGTYTLTADSNDDGTATVAINGAVTGNAALFFSGGGTGTGDTFDDNFNITAGSLTVQNFDTADLAGNVDWTISGAISASSNIGAINSSGNDGTTNMIASTGDASVDLATMTDTNNPNWTIDTQGDLTIAGATSLGTGNFSWTVDTDFDGPQALTINGDITGSSTLVVTGDSDDTLNQNGTVTAASYSINGFGTTNQLSGGNFVRISDGDMLMSAPITSGGDITATSQGSIVDNNAGTDFISTGDATLTAQGGTVGTASNPIDVSVGGDLYITANGQDGNISAVLTGSMGNGQVYVTDDTPGVVIFNNRIVGGGESAAINNTVGQMSARAGPLFMDVTTQPILFDGFGLQTDPGLSALSQDTLSN